MTNTLDGLEAGILEKIREALEHQQYDLATKRTMLARRVQELKRQKERIQAELDETDTTESASVAPPLPSSAALMLVVSQGDLNQNLLRIGELRRRGLVPSDDHPFAVIARSPRGQFEITTTVDQQNSRLRERRLIARFYRENEVRAGDRIAWARLSDGTYSLNKV